MDVSKQIEISRIEELKIIHNVRIIYRHDLNPVVSKENLQVQFDVTGDIRGCITCYLCLDNHDLNHHEKNYLFPLFVESMNILIGKQISLDEEFSSLRIQISPPKLNLNSQIINSSTKSFIHKYELELEDQIFSVLAEYALELIN
jgi:hypothetical protein